MQLIEHRRKPVGLADLLMHHALIDDGILLQQDGSLLAGWTYRGPDMMSSPPSEMDALSARLNSVLKLGSGWMLQCDAIRTEAPGYPKSGAFPDPVTQVIDDERRQQFMAEEAHYESEYFLTLTYLPPVEMEQKVQGFMFEGPQVRQRLHRHTDSGALPFSARTVRERVRIALQNRATDPHQDRG